MSSPLNVSPHLSCSQSGYPSRKSSSPAEIEAFGVVSEKPSFASFPSLVDTKIRRESRDRQNRVHPPTTFASSWRATLCSPCCQEVRCASARHAKGKCGARRQEGSERREDECALRHALVPPVVA